VAELSLKELVRMILHLPGLIILIIIVVAFAVIFLTKSPSLSEQDAEMFISRMEATLEEPGDFTVVALPWETTMKKGSYFNIVRLIAPVGTKGSPVVEVEYRRTSLEMGEDGKFVPTTVFVEKGSKKLDFPVCPRGKISKKACVAGVQELMIEESELKDRLQYSTNIDGVFEFTKDGREYEDPRSKYIAADYSKIKAVEFAVSKFGRILIFPPEYEEKEEVLGFE